MTGQGRRIRALLAICAGVLAAGAVLAWLQSRRPTHPDPPVKPKPATATSLGGMVGAKNGVIIYPDAGPRIWVARAKSITGRSDAGTVELSGVECTLYHEGEATVIVNATRGVAHAQDSAVVISLMDTITARDTQRDLRFTADAFDWSSAHDRISATNVAWRGLGYAHTARHATFSTDLTRADFTGDVRTHTVE